MRVRGQNISLAQNKKKVNVKSHRDRKTKLHLLEFMDRYAN